MLYFALAKRMCFAILSEKEKETREKASGYFKLFLVFEKYFEVTNRPFSHSILPLQCVRTIAPERALRNKQSRLGVDSFIHLLHVFVHPDFD